MFSQDKLDLEKPHLLPKLYQKKFDFLLKIYPSSLGERDFAFTFADHSLNVSKLENKIRFMFTFLIQF